jgi:hypothetical protein
MERRGSFFTQTQKFTSTENRTWNLRGAASAFNQWAKGPLAFQYHTENYFTGTSV